MSVCLRRMRYEDLESMQDCNVNCLVRARARHWLRLALFLLLLLLLLLLLRSCRPPPLS